MKIRLIFKSHPWRRKYTLFHIIYCGGRRRLSLSLEPYLFRTDTMFFNNAYTILGVRINIKHSGGGYFI